MGVLAAPLPTDHRAAAFAVDVLLTVLSALQHNDDAAADAEAEAEGSVPSAPATSLFPFRVLGLTTSVVDAAALRAAIGSVALASPTQTTTLGASASTSASGSIGASASASANASAISTSGGAFAVSAPPPPPIFANEATKAAATARVLLVAVAKAERDDEYVYIAYIYQRAISFTHTFNVPQQYYFVTVFDFPILTDFAWI